MPNTLSIDYGSQHVGVALVDHSGPTPNRVLYATTIEVQSKPLNELVQPRAKVRRIKRTRKTHQRRLLRLTQALAGIPGSEAIVRFCRRRGYSYQAKEEEEQADISSGFHVHRDEFFVALHNQIKRVISPTDQQRVLAACSRHLNEACERDREIRPARFENRGPTKCNWSGCSHHVPRAANDYQGRLQQALYVWLKPVFDESVNPAGLRRSVDHWIAELDTLAKCYDKTEGLDADAKKDSRKPLDRRKNRIARNLMERVRMEATEKVAEKFIDNWKEHYRKNITDIITGKRKGRVTYCRQHSRQYVDYFLAGKVPPNKTDISEADLVSRKQQILFNRLWRLVESRILPLAGGRINRVVVERVAFDILAGKFKNRQKLSEPNTNEMYWQGPMYKFSNRREMLRAEFEGRCAYCDERSATDQVEHMLPKNAFPLDSYFNIVPTCATCNYKKGPRTPQAAGMRITDRAYESFRSYVDGLKVPHLFHNIKKGLLNLLRRSATAAQGERMLGMLANNLVAVTNTQRGPRPLARYLATKLERLTKHRPETAFCAGRHTALYRAAILPEYDKQSMKTDGDLRNHAVDAILLGCNLPSATALENPLWTFGAKDIQRWFEKVRDDGPELLEGLPKVHAPVFLSNFEEDLGLGYCKTDLSAFNWNRSRKATHGLDSFGVTPQGDPLKRIPAADVLKKLLDAKSRDQQIEAIAKSDLRSYLAKDKEHSPERFVGWLQRTTQAGLQQGTMSNHPADQGRHRLLTEFVQTPVAEIVSESNDKVIPWTIGVRCMAHGSRGKIDVARCNGDGEITQRYQSQTVVRELYVGYRLNQGELDRSKPILLYVNQTYAVLRVVKSQRVPVDVPSDSPLHGRALNSSIPLKAFLADWKCAFDQLCDQAEITKQFQITQGCVIEKTDGTRFLFRNFDKSKPWMKREPFKHIQRVYRTPFRVMEKAQTPVTVKSAG